MAVPSLEQLATVAAPDSAPADSGALPPGLPGPPTPARTARWARLPRIVLLLVVLAGVGAGLYQRWAGVGGDRSLIAQGTLEVTEVTISSEVAARIVAIAVEEGQSVRAGDLLVRLDDALPQLQYRQGGSAEQQLLQLQLGKYLLRAPRDGVVLRRSAEPGELALAGAPLLVVADLTNLELTLYILQRDLGRVYLGQAVVLEAQALPGATFDGVVSAVRERAEFTPRNTQTPRDRLNLVFGVTVRLPNADRRLKPGMSVSGRFLE